MFLKRDDIEFDLNYELSDLTKKNNDYNLNLTFYAIELNFLKALNGIIYLCEEQSDRLLSSVPYYIFVYLKDDSHNILCLSANCSREYEEDFLGYPFSFDVELNLFTGYMTYSIDSPYSRNKISNAYFNFEVPNDLYMDYLELDYKRDILINISASNPLVEKLTFNKTFKKIDRKTEEYLHEDVHVDKLTYESMTDWECTYYLTEDKSKFYVNYPYRDYKLVRTIESSEKIHLIKV